MSGGPRIAVARPIPRSDGDASTPEARPPVDADTGEVQCESCVPRMQALAQADIQVAGLEHEIRSLSYKLEELKRDREADARAHELWTPALDVFGLWRTVTGKIEGKNRRIQLSGERFYLVLPFLKSEGEGECQQAVIGRCADHYTSTRQANGSTIHYWEWERIFGSMGQGQTARSNFEESRDRAPDNWQRWVVKAGYEVAT